MSETNDGSDSDRGQVHAYVDCAQKRRWEDHIEDSYEVDSMSEFIRAAAERYVRRQEGESTTTVTHDDPAPSKAIEEQTSQILDAVGELSGQLQDVQQRLSVVESEVTQSREDTDFATKVLHVLPPERPHSDEWEMTKMNRDSDSSVVWSGTVDDIIEHFGGPQTMNYPEDRINGALDQLQSDTSLIEHDLIEGELRYWREE